MAGTVRRVEKILVPPPNDPLRPSTSALNDLKRAELLLAGEIDEDELELMDVPAANETAEGIGIGVAYRAAPEEILKEQFQPKLTPAMIEYYKTLRAAQVEQERKQEQTVRSQNLHQPSHVQTANGGITDDEISDSNETRGRGNFNWRVDAGLDQPTNRTAAPPPSFLPIPHTAHQDIPPRTTVLTPPPNSLVRITRATSKSRSRSRPAAATTTTTTTTTNLRRSSRSRTNITASILTGGGSSNRTGPSVIIPPPTIAQELRSMRSPVPVSPPSTQGRAGRIPLIKEVTKLARRLEYEGIDPGGDGGDLAPQDESLTAAEQKALQELRQVVERAEKRVMGNDRNECFLCTSHQYFIGKDNLYTIFRVALDDIGVRMSYEPEPVLQACADFYADFRKSAAQVGIKLPEMDQAKWLDHMIYHAQMPEAIRYRANQILLALTDVFSNGILLGARLGDGRLDHIFDPARTKGFSLILSQLHRWTTTNISEHNIRSRGWLSANLDPKTAPTLILQSRNDPSALPIFANAVNTPISMQLYQGIANRNVNGGSSNNGKKSGAAGR